MSLKYIYIYTRVRVCVCVCKKTLVSMSVKIFKMVYDTYYECNKLLSHVLVYDWS